jgi:protein-L-isoaspartate(D-aspartate) O-methyltransferase
MARFPGTALIIALALGPGAVSAQTNYESERQTLVEALRDDSERVTEHGVLPISERTLSAIGEVPRHEFVPQDQKQFAYQNRPLPIGAGQTISQPYIVALMTDLAQVSNDDDVLEIGTGSGYQAAVLSGLVKHVYTIEIVELLGKRAAKTLQRLGYNNVTTKIGDGYAGWPDHAPFDAILVTAAPETIPQPLIEQLAVGGRMVVPVGAQHGTQTLQILTKKDDGTLLVEDVIAVRFVPFTRDDY